jgi:hypothetical protein
MFLNLRQNLITGTYVAYLTNKLLDTSHSNQFSLLFSSTVIVNDSLSFSTNNLFLRSRHIFPPPTLFVTCNSESKTKHLYVLYLNPKLHTAPVSYQLIIKFLYLSLPLTFAPAASIFMLSTSPSSLRLRIC